MDRPPSKKPRPFAEFVSQSCSPIWRRDAQNVKLEERGSAEMPPRFSNITLKARGARLREPTCRSTQQFPFFGGGVPLIHVRFRLRTVERWGVLVGGQRGPGFPRAIVLRNDPEHRRIN